MEPGYLKYFKTGELERRANELFSTLKNCSICPRECRINRFNNNSGFCHSSALPIVSSYCIHYGEEPPLIGKNGVGNIFFANCNLNCVFCQNYQISQNWKSEKPHEIGFDKLASIMVELQDKKVSSIGLVSPSHFIPQILKSLQIAVENGFNRPLIYNSNGYDKVESLKYLNGIIDIYLPDFKYAEDDISLNYSKVKNYFTIAKDAISEMYNQLGNQMIYDNDGTLQRGVIIRHLVLPNNLSGTEIILNHLKNNFGNNVYLSIMSQYYPTFKADKYDLINRPIRESEYNKVLSLLEKYEFENGWIQDFNSQNVFRPDFSDRVTPFKKVI